jgi:hypothetical protein
VAAELDAWAAGLAADPVIARGLRAALLAEWIQRVEAADGLPPDRVTNAGTDPPTYWVQLDGRTWLEYAVRDERSGTFRRTRRVIVTGLAGRPGG